VILALETSDHTSHQGSILQVCSVDVKEHEAVEVERLEGLEAQEIGLSTSLHVPIDPTNGLLGSIDDTQVGGSIVDKVLLSTGAEVC
jgi:hypothetical protein